MAGKSRGKPEGQGEGDPCPNGKNDKVTRRIIAIGLCGVSLVITGGLIYLATIGVEPPKGLIAIASAISTALTFYFVAKDSLRN